MKSFTPLLLAFLVACSGQTNNTSNQEEAAMASGNATIDIKDLQGTWLDVDDTLAVIDIRDNQCIFKYTGTPTDSLDHYMITLTDALPGFTDVNSNFTILTNGSDTMRYELTGISADTLSMMYLDRGNMHTYKRSKAK